jgi:DNA-binding MarR family transcriptional regulator
VREAGLAARPGVAIVRADDRRKMKQTRWKMRRCRNESCQALSRAGETWCVVCLGDIGPEDEIEVVQWAPFEDGMTQPREGLVSNAHGATARKAAKRVTPRTGSQRWRVLEQIVNRLEYGQTRDQLARALQLNPNTVRPRVKELLDDGYIKVLPDVTRKGDTGADVEVLVATDKGVALIGRPDTGPDPWDPTGDERRLSLL